MTSKAKPRNTKAIWFSESEYQTIRQQAKAKGLYPRQLIMLKVLGK